MPEMHQKHCAKKRERLGEPLYASTFLHEHEKDKRAMPKSALHPKSATLPATLPAGLFALDASTESANEAPARTLHAIEPRGQGFRKNE